jgi:hypothetical protein
MMEMRSALGHFAAIHDRYPTEEEGLQILVTDRHLQSVRDDPRSEVVGQA